MAINHRKRGPKRYFLDGERRRPEIPNLFAYIALYAWPFITLSLFLSVKVERAAVWSIVAGYLLLPSEFTVDIAGLPPLNKYSVTVASTALLVVARTKKDKTRQFGPIMYIFSLGYIIAPIATTFNNSYELRSGGLSISGYYLADGMKTSILHMIQLLSIFVGFRVLSTSSGRTELLRALIFGALLYSVLMAIEVRLSPQLHRWIYGYMPSSFGQQIRWGGYRPVVFLSHGLHVALFVTMALLACLIAVRMRWRVLGLSARSAAVYLSLVLALCKTLGATLYAGLLAPFILFTRPKVWVRVASVLLALVASYPVLRSQNLIPTQTILMLATNASLDRGESLSVRLSNEDSLLRKAMEKPAFGWGGFGRPRIFDRDSGKDLSITDGGWIIILGVFGWLGYICYFGLLTAPVLRLNSRISGGVGADEVIVAGLSLVLAANVVDLIPNDNLTPITYLMVGSIAGYRRATRPRATVAERTTERNEGEMPEEGASKNAGSEARRLLKTQGAPSTSYEA